MGKKFKLSMLSLIMTITILSLTGLQNVLARESMTQAYSLATVQSQQQRQSNWCWATCSSVILQRYGINASQEDIVRYIKGGLYNQTATAQEMLQAVRGYGLRASLFGVPSFQQIQQEINGGNPMETLINWTNGGGHALVLDGYFLNKGRNYINIMDPWYGDHFNYNYEYYKINNQFRWTGTIGYFRR